MERGCLCDEEGDGEILHLGPCALGRVDGEKLGTDAEIMRPYHITRIIIEIRSDRVIDQNTITQNTTNRRETGKRGAGEKGRKKDVRMKYRSIVPCEVIRSDNTSPRDQVPFCIRPRREIVGISTY